MNRLVNCRLTRLVCVLLVGVLSSLALGLKGIDAQEDKIEEHRVLLETSVVLNSSGPTVAFTMTNNSTANIPSIEAGRDPSRIVVIKPDGQEVEDYHIADPAPGVPQLTLKPKESITSKRNIFELFGALQLKTPGRYGVYWKLSQRNNGQLIEYKSNVVPIIREKGTPVYNPVTGRNEPE